MKSNRFVKSLFVSIETLRNAGNLKREEELKLKKLLISLSRSLQRNDASDVKNTVDKIAFIIFGVINVNRAK